MGDEEDGVMVGGKEIGEELLLGGGIESTRRLIKKKDAAVAQKSASYANALCLSLGKTGTKFGADSIETIGQFEDKVSASQMESIVHLLLRSLSIAEKEIVAYAATEQSVALRHINHIASCEGRHLNGGTGGVVHLIIYIYMAGSRMQESLQETEKSSLAGTRLTKNASASARAEVEAEVTNDRRLRIIRVGEGHGIKANAAGSLYENRIARCLKLRFFEFHESLGSRKHLHEERCEPGKVACRRLNLVDELQESGHTAIGKRAAIQAESTPSKGDEISKGETEVEYKTRKQRETSAAAHLALQYSVLRIETIDHAILSFESLDEHTMLHGLLQKTLHTAVRFAYITRILTHTLHVNLAQYDKDRQDCHDKKRQHMIHGEEIKKSSEEHGKYGDDIRQRLREEVDDSANVGFEAIDDVAAVHVVAAFPLRTQYAIKHTALHTVLRLDAKDIAHPDLRHAQHETAEDECRHKAHGKQEVAFGVSARYVDGALHRPHL